MQHLPLWSCCLFSPCPGEAGAALWAWSLCSCTSDLWKTEAPSLSIKYFWWYKVHRRLCPTLQTAAWQPTILSQHHQPKKILFLSVSSSSPLSSKGFDGILWPWASSNCSRNMWRTDIIKVVKREVHAHHYSYSILLYLHARALRLSLPAEMRFCVH